MLKALDDELAKARKMNITVDDDEAYLRCCQLLEQEFQAEEQKFNKLRKKLKINIQTVQEHIDICQGQKNEIIKQKQIIEEQLKQLDIQIAKVKKKHKKQEHFHDEIDEQKRMIEVSNNKLQDLKEKSYQQKNLYLRAQQVEMNIADQLAIVEQQERLYYDFKSREEKYRQLSKILQKLHNKTSYTNKDVELYLKDKISQMSILRANLLSIDEKLQDFNVFIEQQNYIIEGLRYKSEVVQENDNSAYKKYQSKYQELYFDRKNNLDNWKSYKSYLEELLKRNKIQPHFRNQQDNTYNRYKLKSSYQKNPSFRTEPNVFQIIDDDEPSLSPSFKNIHTPQLKKKNSQQPMMQRQAQSVRLPKLVKMRGEQSKVKQDLKANIKRMINESDISLESVDSKDQNMSGEFIEVQFHKK